MSRLTGFARCTLAYTCDVSMCKAESCAKNISVLLLMLLRDIQKCVQSDAFDARLNVGLASLIIRNL